jgi:hypothetical protein
VAIFGLQEGVEFNGEGKEVANYDEGRSDSRFLIRDFELNERKANASHCAGIQD